MTSPDCSILFWVSFKLLLQLGKQRICLSGLSIITWHPNFCTVNEKNCTLKKDFLFYKCWMPPDVAVTKDGAMKSIVGKTHMQSFTHINLYNLFLDCRKETRARQQKYTGRTCKRQTKSPIWCSNIRPSSCETKVIHF